MTTAEVDVTGVFADAEGMHAAALERLAAGDIRDAADKAWCAALQATNALILARTGTEPEISSDTTRGLTSLSAEDPDVRPLRRRYFSRQSELHGACFYLGACDPIEEVERRIRQTADYISDAARLAGYSDAA